MAHSAGLRGDLCDDTNASRRVGRLESTHPTDRQLMCPTSRHGSSTTLSTQNGEDTPRHKDSRLGPRLQYTLKIEQVAPFSCLTGPELLRDMGSKYLLCACFRNAGDRGHGAP